MSTPRPDIEHWWAVEAMIASYNHVYQTIYNTQYQDCGAIGVSIYNDAPIANFHYEFLVLGADRQDAINALESYPIPEGKKYVVNLFHSTQALPDLHEYFAEQDLEFVQTSPILGFELPLQVSTIPLNIHKAKTLQHTEVANNSLTAEGERIHLQTLRDKQIHNFYVKEDDLAVGWIQLVTKYPNVGYINHLYVMKEYRQRRYATTLLNAAHAEALKLGIKKMVAIPSDMSASLFQRMGYNPLLFFSVFRPKPYRKFPIYNDQPGEFTHSPA